MKLTNVQLEKVKSICFSRAKKFRKVRYYDKDFDLFQKDGVVYARFMHWTNDELGLGIMFAFENKGNLLKSADWVFITWEDANYPQLNSIINTIDRIGSDYKRMEISK